MERGGGQILAYGGFCELSQDQSAGTKAAAGDFGFNVLALCHFLQLAVEAARWWGFGATSNCGGGQNGAGGCNPPLP